MKDDLEQHACPGAGACGGMYTANTMSTAIEAMGLCLPGSSSNPAESPAKMRECTKAAEAIRVCMEKNIRPLDLLTKESFENALVSSHLSQSELPPPSVTRVVYSSKQSQNYTSRIRFLNPEVFHILTSRSYR